MAEHEDLELIPGPAITASMLYDLVTCERRVHHDIHTDSALRDPVGSFVRMLWEGGRKHEQTVFAALPGHIADLRDIPLQSRAAVTLAAMNERPAFILGGRLELGDRVGMPDLLRTDGDGWVAGDVKSGSALAPDGRRPRFEYAVQVGFYAQLLADLGLGTGSSAFVVGSDGSAAEYDLTAPSDRQSRTIADRTASLADRARAIRSADVDARGALSAICKMCHWHTLCERELVSQDDLTLLAGVGRSIRDALFPIAPTVQALAAFDLGKEPRRGSPARGVGADRLRRFRERARLMITPGAQPYAVKELGLSSTAREIHFDIEADPSRNGFVYLHGFWTREPGDPPEAGRYDFFFAETQDEEGEAFAKAIAFLSADPDAKVYYYSKYERSSFRQLARRHPSVCTEDEIETLFNPTRAIDLLFDVITPSTEWPTRNLSIKTLARSLGFEWGDADASGANSIAWYDEYARTGDAKVRQRILDYNRDDVVASAVVLDGLRNLNVAEAAPWPQSTGSGT